MLYSRGYWDDVQSVIENIPNIDMLFGKSILITGSTGMVCSSIIDIIALLNRTRNASIYLFLAGRSKQRIKKRFEGVLKQNEYEYIKYDATKNQMINLKVDYIIHGASNANPTIYAREPVETLLGNIIGLKPLLEVARSNRGSRLLYISSSEIYGNRVDNQSKPYKEEDYGYIDILNPRACYPNGKRAAETLCASYGAEYDTDFVITRLGHIYGPSITEADTRASADFTKNAAEGHDIIMKSAGNQLRSYCYTLDCATAILTVLINGEAGNAYNVSNSFSIISIRDFAEIMAHYGGVNIVFENASDSEKKGYNLMTNSALDAEKLEKLGWKSSFSIERGIKATLRYYGY